MGTLRILVACPQCGAQFDASGRSAGSSFHCTCGKLLAVPRPRPHDAAVVRCSACGAPRQGMAPACSFCGADFTLHEKDLDTLCSSCMARISRRARFCHHCATPLVVQGDAGAATEHPCPACGEARKLASRRLDGRELAALECGHCAGLFVARQAFRLLAEDARKGQLSHREHGRPAPRLYLQASAPAPQRGAFYRTCPHCRRMMVRQNYGRSSGVIIDLCHEHGAWFDSEELDRILAWIRKGGLAAEDERRVEELNLAERERRLKEKESGAALLQPVRAERTGFDLAAALSQVVAGLFS